MGLKEALAHGRVNPKAVRDVEVRPDLTVWLVMESGRKFHIDSATALTALFRAVIEMETGDPKPLTVRGLVEQA